MAEVLTYRRAVARNIAVWRTARVLTQRDVASRMAALGFEWRQQTVARVESGQRPVAVEELWGLAEVLGTQFQALLTAREPNVAPNPDLTVALPSGEPVKVEDIQQLIYGQTNGHITWDGIEPSYQPGGWQPARDASKPQGWSGPVDSGSRAKRTP